jgi:hypothetical protein
VWKRILRDIGVTEPADVDVATAMVKGLVDQQITNDPAGDRWVRHLDAVIDMFLDHVDNRKRRRR